MPSARRRALQWRSDRELDRDVEILNWVPKKTEDKTGLELAIPVHPELRRIIDAIPSEHLSFLVTELGAPFTAAGFGNWFRDRCKEAALAHCSFHGLRKSAATRLIDAGCDVVEAAAVTGHASLKELSATSRRGIANAPHDGRCASSYQEQKCQPRPSGLTIRRKKHDRSEVKFGSGSPSRIRTSDQPVNSRFGVAPASALGYNLSN
jgi:Phage integrase family